ncbi:hypothetical protein ABRQ03_08715 [Pectobacterium jejuense]|uniref:hypothetical protein n=1 Tax=Pectobacterium TaxID=122277 RepID=UPI0011C42B76|nr:hypothetical protein [Pectobacterium carotovorum]
MAINLNVRSASVILSILLISGCSNGKLRIGEPPEGGVIHAIEKTYPDKSGMMVSSWPYVTLHADSDTFVFLKKFCEEKNYNFENILPSLGWCISDDEYPLFVFFDDRTGRLGIREKSTNTKELEWVNYTKNEFKILWYNHK